MYIKSKQEIREKTSNYTGIKRISIYAINIKKNFFPILFLMFTASLLIFSKNSLTAAKKGLQLWANSVVPCLFSFFVATELLSKTEIPHYLGKILCNIMKPLFNVPGEASFALIMGLISGYPIGAKIATNFRKNNVCSKEECERILSFTNNSGPLFIVGTVGISMFGSSYIGYLLLITHILAAITVGMIFKFWKKNTSNFTESSIFKSTHEKNIQISNLGEILSTSITNSISTILLIGGFIVLFSVIISMLKSSHLLELIVKTCTPFFDFINISPEFIAPIFTGLFEITNGIVLISNINIKAISISLILTSFLLGIGGLSIFFQVFSITSKSDISIKPYIYGKILQGIFASIYTYCFIQIFPIFNFNL